MKGFTRAETCFSLCGLNCALCAMHMGGYCPGCGGGAGNQSCAIPSAPWSMAVYLLPLEDLQSVMAASV